MEHDEIAGHLKSMILAYSSQGAIFRAREALVKEVQATNELLEAENEMQKSRLSELEATVNDLQQQLNNSSQSKSQLAQAENNIVINGIHYAKMGPGETNAGMFVGMSGRKVVVHEKKYYEETSALREYQGFDFGGQPSEENGYWWRALLPCR